MMWSIEFKIFLVRVAPEGEQFSVGTYTENMNFVPSYKMRIGDFIVKEVIHKNDYFEVWFYGLEDYALAVEDVNLDLNQKNKYDSMEAMQLEVGRRRLSPFAVWTWKAGKPL